MKKGFAVLLILLSLLLLTGCQPEAYELKEAAAAVTGIELVHAEDSRNFTVIKALSETERQDFLPQLQRLQTHSYMLGDPLSVSGDAIKITYENGNYEIICDCWAEYVTDGAVYFIRKNVDDAEFRQLWDTFAE